MPFFRKKPVVIEAVLYTGENALHVLRWMGLGEEALVESHSHHGSVTIVEIETREGTMAASPGDWIIKGVKGEFYPCKPDIFTLTYETAE